jgi:hypothetical protein
LSGYPTNDSQKLAWKQTLKNACIQLLHARIAHIEQAITEAREAANSEEKSSAGDKYETSRAMSHLAQEMQGRQLEDAKQELDFINRLNTTDIFTAANTGAVVICPDIIFYISLGLGNTLVDSYKVMLLSPKAPIAGLLYRKKAADTFEFNKKTIQIQSIF